MPIQRELERRPALTCCSTVLRLAAAAALTASSAASAQPVAPYAEQQYRSIKALSDDEAAQYLAGAGMGYAKAAELNHYPGPQHVLEFGDRLSLSAEQRARTIQLMEAHKADARALGLRVVAAERALDEFFASGRDDPAELARKVSDAAATHGQYRLAHLETHRRMRALLTGEQVGTYDVLRGYSSGSQQTPHHRAH